MATNVIMPKLGMTMTEGTIIKWHKKVGDAIEEGLRNIYIIKDTKDGFKCCVFLCLQFEVFFVAPNPVRQECL